MALFKKPSHLLACSPLASFSRSDPRTTKVVTTSQKDVSDWQAENLTLQTLHDLLVTDKPDGLLLTHVPNARVTADLQALHLLSTLDHKETVGELRKRQEQPAQAIEPEAFWRLGEELSYQVNVTWSDSAHPGAIDVLFRRDDSTSVMDLPYQAALETQKPLHEWVNNPMQGELARGFVPRLRTFLKEKLPEYMVPAAFVELPALPLLPNGKINRRKLPAPEKLRSTSAPIVLPRTPTEEMLTAIWSDVLGIEQTSLGIHDNFFELGGDSILSIRIITRAKKKGLALAPKQLFEHQTIAELAEYIEKTRSNDLNRSNDFSRSDQKTTEVVTTGRPRTTEVVTTGIEDTYPLSPLQEGMLFHTLYEQAPGMYLTQSSCLLHGPLNKKAFRAAWEKVVARHAALRTAFYSDHLLNDGQPVASPRQVVYKQVELPWQELDYGQKIFDLKQFLATDRQQPFELSSAPLMRCTVIKIGPDHHQFIWSSHHILADGWSGYLIFKEVMAFYEAALRGERLIGLRLDPPLGTQRPFRDYVMWLEQQDTTAAEAFWRQSLQGVTAPTSLVVDKTGSVEREANQNAYDEYDLRFSPALSATLKATARQHHLTLNTLMQGAWAMLLSRYNNRQSDVLFGATVSSRPLALSGIESTVGLLINSLPVRVHVAEEANLASWLSGLQNEQVEREVYAHSSLVDIHGWSEIPRGTPLFKSVLVFKNELPEIFTLQSPLQLSQLRVFGQNNYPLTLLIEPKEQVTLTIAYDTSRFERETIRRMTGHLYTLLGAMASDLTQKIRTYPLLTPAETHQLLVEWNQTAVDYAFSDEMGIHDFFTEQAARTPEAVAVRFPPSIGREQGGAGQLTYRELNQKTNQLAHYLIDLGVGPDVLVGICIERSLEMVIGLLAILKAGGAYVPLDPTYPPERLSFMHADSEVAVLLTSQKVKDSLAHSGKQICLDSDWLDISQMSRQNPPRRINGHHLAYMTYTSGSTGTPKGVMSTHAGIRNRLFWVQETCPLTAQDRVLQKTPFSFNVSVWEVFWPLMVGARLVVASPEGHKDPAYLVDLIGREKITHLHFVPSMLQLFLNADGLEGLTSLKRVICSGEALPLALTKRFFSQIDAELHNLYGPTEAAIDVTHWACHPEQVGNVPIGHPVANTQLYILDRQLQPVPIGVPGELHIGGVQVARGYWKRPTLTQERFIPNPFVPPGSGNALTPPQSWEGSRRLYKTSDLCRYLPDGNIEFLGRLDHQVKIRGFRVELGEIEAHLTQHEAIRDAVVVAQKRSEEQQLVAYLVPNVKEKEIRIDQVRPLLREKLPDYMVPSAFVQLEAFPLTPNGKINRRALPDPEFRPNENENQSAFVPPRDPIEQKLSQLWQEVLGVPVGIEDNFFDVGGHSLLAIRLFTTIQQQFSHAKQLPLSTLFQQPTIEQLARALRQPDASLSWESLVPIQPKGKTAPLFCLPGIEGSVINLYQLGRHLPTIPFYGLQAVGLDGTSPPYTTIEEMAAHYISSIKTVQPTGPYFLAAHSFGGQVAFEMAQQLKRSGSEVALLALFDAMAPLAEPDDDSEVLDWQLDWQKTIQSLSPEAQLAQIKQRLQITHLLPAESDSQLIAALIRVIKSNAQIHYMPKQIIPTPITLFRAQEEIDKSSDSPYAGWDAFAPVSLHVVPGNHITMMKSPHVEVLARQLSTIIAGINTL